MKSIFCWWLSVGLLANCGCISTHLVQDKAQTHLAYPVADQPPAEVPCAPAYYALLPVTITGDVLTSPFQLIYFYATHDDHWSTASFQGVPIPLP